MEISAIVDENTYEMFLSLKLTGAEAAGHTDTITLYAQFEDPENPGVYESFTCSTEIFYDKTYLDYSYVWVNNYSGSKLLKEGSADVTGKIMQELNESDLVGDGLPWIKLLAREG